MKSSNVGEKSLAEEMSVFHSCERARAFGGIRPVSMCVLKEAACVCVCVHIYICVYVCMYVCAHIPPLCEEQGEEEGKRTDRRMWPVAG